MASYTTSEGDEIDDKALEDPAPPNTAKMPEPFIIKEEESPSSASQIFINLPVRDLLKTTEFFISLGFKFDPRFTDHNATCMIIGKNMYAMLLSRDFFQTFTDKNVLDAERNTEVIISLFMNSKKEVDDLVEKAVEAGARIYTQPQDHVWMYSQGFSDLDGHQWELFFMDESKMPQFPGPEVITELRETAGTTTDTGPTAPEDVKEFSKRANY